MNLYHSQYKSINDIRFDVEGPIHHVECSLLLTIC